MPSTEKYVLLNTPFQFFFQEKILKISFIGLQEVLPGTCKVSPWITGTKNYRSSTVKDHEESDLHKMAVRASKPIELSEAGQSLIKLNELQRAQISKLFHNVHALVVKHKSFLDYIWMCDLDQAKGIDIGASYRNDKEAKLFATYIAKRVRNEIRYQIREVSFIAITSDSATDKSVKQQESIRVHMGRNQQSCRT